MSHPVIEARRLCVPGRAGRAALDDVNLEVRAGEVFSLAAAADAGASSIVEACLGLVPVKSGRAIVAGVDARINPQAARRHATVAARWAPMLPSLTPVRNVEYFTRMAGARVTRGEAERALRRMCVAERDFNRPLGRLAPDIRPLLWLAVAALRDVSGVLLDDPPAGGERAFALEEAIAVSAEDGRAVLLATADARLAAAVGHRAAILRDGRLAGIRTRPDLAGDGLSAFYLEYLGRRGAKRSRAS